MREILLGTSKIKCVKSWHAPGNTVHWSELNSTGLAPRVEQTLIKHSDHVSPFFFLSVLSFTRLFPDRRSAIISDCERSEKIVRLRSLSIFYSLITWGCVCARLRCVSEQQYLLLKYFEPTRTSTQNRALLLFSFLKYVMLCSPELWMENFYYSSWREKEVSKNRHFPSKYFLSAPLLCWEYYFCADNVSVRWADAGGHLIARSARLAGCCVAYW